MAIRKRLRPAVANIVCRPLRVLGDVAVIEGRASEAESCYKKALELDLADKEESSQLMAGDDYFALAKLYARFGTTDGDSRAIDALKAEIGILEQAYGSDSLATLSPRMMMAGILEKSGQYDAADACLLRAETLASSRKDAGIDRRSMSQLLLKRAQINDLIGRADQAAKLRARASAL